MRVIVNGEPREISSSRVDALLNAGRNLLTARKSAPNG